MKPRTCETCQRWDRLETGDGTRLCFALTDIDWNGDMRGPAVTTAPTGYCWHYRPWSRLVQRAREMEVQPDR